MLHAWPKFGLAMETISMTTRKDHHKTICSPCHTLALAKALTNATDTSCTCAFRGSLPEKDSSRRGLCILLARVGMTCCD